MENTYINIQANKQIDENLINDKKREVFFKEFLEEDDWIKYIIIDGVEDDLILNKKQLLTLLKTSNIDYLIVDPHKGYSKVFVNGRLTTIEYI